MSPLPPPPPAGTIVPSDDWTDDASFDFTEELRSPSKPAATAMARVSLGGLGSPSRQSFARPHSTAKPALNDDDDDLDFDFDDEGENKDGTDSFPALNSRFPSSTPVITHSTPFNVNANIKSRPGSASASKSASKNLSSIVMGSGPGGIGTITKLASKPTPLPKGSIKLKAAAVSKAWEEDMDFDDLDLGDGDGDGNDDGDWKTKLLNGPKGHIPGATKVAAGSIGLDGGLSLGPLIMRTRVMPDANALDDLDDFGLDDEEEDREATLKASATLKARLPPPRPKTVLPTTTSTTQTPLPQPRAIMEDDNLDNDADFELPLNLTNLNLASRSGSSTRSQQPKQSRMSGVSLDWDSPGTSTSTSGGGGGPKTGWWSESPSKRFSEASGTSISDGITPAKGGKGKGKEANPVLGNGNGNGEGKPKLMLSGSTMEAEDMEDGLVLPTKGFFATTSKRELDSLLDRKRKPQFAAHNANANAGDITLRPGTSQSGRGFEEGMEDGLVFEDHGKELTMNRLTMGKKARSQIPIAMKRTTGTRLVPKDRTREREHARDTIHQMQTLGNRIRHPSHDLLGRTPALNALRDRAQSTAGHRSHSTGNVGTGTIKPFSPTRPASPPLQQGSPSKSSASGSGFDRERDRDRETLRSRSGQPFSSMYPPSTPRSGLRHQKSHQVLSSPSPAKSSGSSLMKKQSLSSLHDTYTASTVGSSVLQTLAEDPNATVQVTGEMKERYHNSTSRLTMPTSSSKAKSRPPISAVFPMQLNANANTNAQASASTSTPGPPPHSHTQSPPLSTRSKIRQGHMGVHPKRRDWGDGTELEGIEDLEVDMDDKEKKSSWSKSARSKCMSPGFFT